MSESELFFNSLAVVLLAGVSGISFGFLVLFGELIKPLTVAYSEPESTFLDLWSNQQAISIGGGLLAIIILLGLKWSKMSDKTCVVLNLALVTLGAILFTGGCLIIGWEPPNLLVYTNILMTMVAPGCGLVFWGSSNLVFDQLDLSTWRNKVMIALYLCASPLFIMLFFPSLQLTTSDDFYEPYRTVGTLMTPLTMLLVVVTISMLGTPNEKQTSSLKKPAPNAVMWWTSFLCFATARSLFFGVFGTSVSLFPNYVVHIGGNETGFESLEVGLEDRVVRDCLLWMAAGSIIGRVLFTMMPGDLMRVFYHASAMGVLGGWYVRINNTSFVASTGVELCAVAFFIGFTIGQIFIDFLLVTANKYEHPHVPLELKTLFIGVGMLVMTSCMRLSVGFFGGLGDGIDWKFVATLNLCIMGGVTGLELVGMAVFPKSDMEKIASE